MVVKLLLDKTFDFCFDKALSKIHHNFKKTSKKSNQVIQPLQLKFLARIIKQQFDNISDKSNIQYRPK